MNSNASPEFPNLDKVQAKATNGLRVAYAALGIPIGMLVLSWFVAVMRPRWDSSVIPLLCLVGGMIPAMVAIVLSTLSLRQQRSATAINGLLLGVLAIPVCLAITWWLAMMGIASHPI